MWIQCEKQIKFHHDGTKWDACQWLGAMWTFSQCDVPQCQCHGSPQRCHMTILNVRALRPFHCVNRFMPRTLAVLIDDVCQHPHLRCVQLANMVLLLHHGEKCKAVVWWFNVTGVVETQPGYNWMIITSLDINHGDWQLKRPTACWFSFLLIIGSFSTSWLAADNWSQWASTLVCSQLCKFGSINVCHWRSNVVSSPQWVKC